MSDTNPIRDASTEELLAAECERYEERTPESAAMAEDLRELVPAGVCSTFRAYDPYPVHAARAEGGSIYDVDGNEYLDFALNNGTQLVGHTHPTLEEAAVDQIERGTLYTRPTDLIEFAARPLIDRWDAIEQVRFTNSGTESIMHATRLARAYTGREKIIRMEGAYHGAHDPALVSKMPPLEQAGPERDPRPVRESRGVPDSVPEDILLAQYNDAESVERLLRDHGAEVAAVLVEPACLNLGLVEPEDGFLERLRELADEYNVVLIFDEVKTGVKLAPGGGAEYYGVQPDLVALAKAIGGGYPVGAFGGRREIMDCIAADLNEGVATGAAHYGTYNGNPLALRAVGVTLREILTEDAYDHVTTLADRLADGYRDVIADTGLEATVKSVGSQGMVHFTDEPIRTFRDWGHVDEEFHEAYWFGMVNRGVIPHPHDASQQWTVSVQHTAEEIDAHVDAFADLATHLTAAQQ
ncbi:aminotransferase class III-fold pyridoxal phosphate-dependent enzyme [Natronorubrum sp. JWXQ-INN-674]|uniref:Glutamate-1-semialdehyde 2,1-aminomutase n=1 Tax=Natronorubrum halalkaliphilum TaxID=2691917 RepID=A0A6B0VGN5_9EURY|nr:aspartate aminotransferase family protein [Natronorubrum halalkaliphilum]MXV60680.1 aminotransferase class III-fold pyridoxal phosphate-dependent enzyme [Natronorubrum halalkaliphilum]